jgi:hypothetical protein
VVDHVAGVPSPAHGGYFVTALQQSLTKVAADKTEATGDKYLHYSSWESCLIAFAEIGRRRVGGATPDKTKWSTPDETYHKHDCPDQANDNGADCPPGLDTIVPRAMIANGNQAGRSASVLCPQHGEAARES